MEVLSNIEDLNLQQLKNRDFVPDDTGSEEAGPEEIEAEGGKILERRGLIRELGEQVEIFHSKEYNEAREGAGNE